MAENKLPNFRYAVMDHDPESQYELFCPHTGPGDLKWIAEAAAEDYHSEHDGWDAVWPLTFTIYDIHGNRLGQAVVDREAVPQFHARNIVLG